MRNYWKTHASILFTVLLLTSLSVEISLTAQNNLLQGPILVSQSVFNEEITFQDIGTGRVWGIETPFPIYSLYGWTPDGCKVLLNNGDKALSIMHLVLEDFSSLGRPLWSLDEQSIYFLSYSDEVNTTNIYLINMGAQNPVIIHSVDSWLTDIRWLSENELIYSTGYSWFVLDVATGQIHEIVPNPYQSPAEISTDQFYDYSTEHISPNWEMRLGFYSMSLYNQAWIAGMVDHEMSEDEENTLEAQEPRITGFDIYFLVEKTVRHVNVNGLFVQSLVWSPSSNQIAVTTDASENDYGVFVYNIESDTLQRLADAYIDPPSLNYVPSWSPDEEWLAFRTQEGYFVQNILDGERIRLDAQMNGLTLHWSPVMNYADTQCE